MTQLCQFSYSDSPVAHLYTGVILLLLCPVRDCHRPLHREQRRFLCERGHSFDIAKSGYVNLLQPQERRSKHPGDSAEAVAARRRLHDRGVTRPLLDGIRALLAAAPGDFVLDAGCGDGFYLGSLARECGFTACGIDISIPAVDAAARRYPECQWLVANADRVIPCVDQSFDKLLSITARMNAPEFRRVLKQGGLLLVAIPAPDDFSELRGAGRDRAERTLATFCDTFTLTARQRVTTTAALDADAVRDVLLSIYRPLRAEPVVATQMTFSLDLLLFKLLEPLQ
jgi:23S rRNA (guanine745-N1)-methyltransferase